MIFIVRRHRKKAAWVNDPATSLDSSQGIGIDGEEIKSARPRRMSRSICSFALIFEIIIALVHPLPYFDFPVTMSTISIDKSTYEDVHYIFGDFLLAFMVFRIIFIARAILNYSVFNDLYAFKLW